MTRLRNVDLDDADEISKVGEYLPVYEIRVYEYTTRSNNQQGQFLFSIEMRMIDALWWFCSTTTGSRVPVFSYDIIEV